MPWLDEIRAELDGFTPESLKSFEPQTEAEKGEHVVGELADDLKKLLSLVVRYRKKAREAFAALIRSVFKEGAAYEENLLEYMVLSEKARVLKEIFHISINSAFNLWQKPMFGVRKGWKVVWVGENTKTGEETPIPSFFVPGKRGQIN